MVRKRALACAVSIGSSVVKGLSLVSRLSVVTGFFVVSRLSVVTRFSVVSGLAPRWAAKRPQHLPMGYD